MSALLTLHHLNNSRSQRILWLLEELGVPYALKIYQRQPPKMSSPAELRDVHSSGQSPIVTDGAFTIAESGAIIDYLIATYGKGRFLPQGTQSYIDNAYYSHYAEGSFMPLVSSRHLMTLWPKRIPSNEESAAQPVLNRLMNDFYDPALKTRATLLAEHIAKQPDLWLAGGPEPTAADFMMGFVVNRMLQRCPGAVEDPNADNILVRYLTKMIERPAFQRALQKDSSFEYFVPGA